MSSNRVFTRAEQSETPISHYINCSFQELDIFPYTAVPTDTSPLFFLHQVTVRDGTLLVFGIHHHFSDGHGFFTLINRFATWIREKDDLKIPSFIFDRLLLKPASEIRYEHIEYSTNPPSLNFTQMPVMDVIVKKYTKEQLFDQLKITNTNLSFNNVLVAWLTQTISQIRGIPSEETVRVGMASDGRNELCIGSNYFGNCNFYICFQFQMKDIIDKSINDLAEQINREKKTTNDKRLYHIRTCMG